MSGFWGVGHMPEFSNFIMSDFWGAGHRGCNMMYFENLAFIRIT